MVLKHQTKNELGMVSLTIDETRAFVEKLMASGKGDPGRLTHILAILNEGRQLYHSDKKYLNEKFSQEIGLQEKLKVDVDIISKIQNLISCGTGDTGRLQFIMEFLKQGKMLYKSDEQYLESKLGEKINYQEIISAKQDSDKTMETLKSQVSWANQKIANLESVIHDKMDQLQSTHKQQGTLPKGFTAQTQSLDQIQKQLAHEQANLNHEKTEAEKIRIEQSKLTQIILDRKEFEKQVSVEKEQLKKQIEQERQNMTKQNQLVEQIKAQEAQLDLAKKERDGIISQLQREQAEIASQAEIERSKLAEQALAAKKIQQDKEQLKAIQLENEKILKETKLQEHHLEEQVKQEKEKLATQAKLLKTIESHEKFLTQTKQRQAALSVQIAEQKKTLLFATPTLSQVKSDQELLNSITSQRNMLEAQVKAASADLKSIKKEKLTIEKQIKSQKSQITRAKKKEETKIKQLEQKKKAISKSAASESQKIKKLAKS